MTKDEMIEDTKRMDAEAKSFIAGLDAKLAERDEKINSEINPTVDNNDIPVLSGLDEPIFSGLTLRNYFAAAALTGILSARYVSPELEHKVFENAAFDSFICADTMLAERLK